MSQLRMSMCSVRGVLVPIFAWAESVLYSFIVVARRWRCRLIFLPVKAMLTEMHSTILPPSRTYQIILLGLFHPPTVFTRRRAHQRSVPVIIGGAG